MYAGLNCAAFMADRYSAIVMRVVKALSYCGPSLRKEWMYFSPPAWFPLQVPVGKQSLITLPYIDQNWVTEGRCLK